jgi:hypothetical protein
MSAVASFHVLDRVHVPALLRAPHEVPRTLGRVAGDYHWSGYCIVHLVEYLGDLGITLYESEYDRDLAELDDDAPFTVLITPAHKRFLPYLDPVAHSEADIAAHFEEAQYAFEEAGTAGREGIALLRDGITALTDDEVLVVQVC